MGRHKPDLIQSILPIRLFPKKQVTVVDRIKCSPKNTDASHRIPPLPAHKPDVKQSRIAAIVTLFTEE